MKAHEKGDNYVDFYPEADKLYLVTTGDDKTVKVWIISTRAARKHVSFAVLHTNLPTIVNSSEDGTIKILNSGTYRIGNTLSYALERAWCVALRKDVNEVGVDFDEGVVAIKVCSF